MMNSAEVFTPVAADYARYRPGYPTELMDEIAELSRHPRLLPRTGGGTGRMA